MGIGRWRGAFRTGGGWRVGCPRARRCWWLDGMGRVRQQLLAHEAGVPGAALGVQDLEVRAPAGWPVAVARDGHRAALPDHVPAQPDPAGPLQLEPQAARLLDGRREPAPERVRLHDHEQRPGAPRERREPAQPVPHAHAADRRVPAVREVDDEEVHGPGREERSREREGLLEVDGGEHDEPFRLDPAGDGLDRVEGPGQVEPGDDRARRLGLRRQPERDGGLAGRGAAAQGHGGGARQPAHAEDGVEGGEPGGDDAAVRVGGRRCRPGRAGRRCRGRHRGPQRHERGAGSRELAKVVGVIQRHQGRRQRERAIDHRPELATPPRSCRTPASLERRECLGDVGCACHRTSNTRTYVLLWQGRNARRGHETAPTPRPRAPRRRRRAAPTRATAWRVAARPAARSRTPPRSPARTSSRGRPATSAPPRGRPRRRRTR